jgi:hypothetical protein
VNAVPRKPTLTAGVVMLKFSLEVVPPTNRNTPFNNEMETAVAVGFGLYTKSSRFTHDVGPIDSWLSSLKMTREALASAVTTLSLWKTPRPARLMC